MGIGVLYGRQELLDAMPPFMSGGEMIDSVSRDGAVYAELPHKFEAGTVNAAGAAGLAAAIGYIKEVGFDYIEKRELELTTRAMEGLAKLPHVKEVRDQGLLVGVEFDDTISGVDVKHGCLDRHLLITAIGAHTIRMVPPLIITEEDCDQAAAIIEETVKALSE
mgnify:CR=1 FL=1